MGKTQEHDNEHISSNKFSKVNLTILELRDKQNAIDNTTKLKKS